MRKNSVKNIRINSEVQKEIANIIREDLKDPRINPIMTSVMEVIVTPDLKFAKIYISVMGDKEAKEKTMEGLKHCSSFIRKKLASRMNMRFTPELTFVYDNSIEYALNMSEKIEKLKKDAKNEDEV